MPKLPILTSREVARGLIRLGFQEIGQRGSHLKFRRGSATVIVPNHREIRKGTLGSILQQAGVGIDELIAALSH